MSSETFTVMIGMPEPRDDAGNWPVDNHGRPAVAQWVPIGEAKTWGIARFMAYTLAQRGIPTAWPKPDNSRELPVIDHWFTCSVQRAMEAGQAHLEMVFREALSDRAMLAAQEARNRGRIGNILGELRSISQSSENPEFALLVERGVVLVSQAMSLNIMPLNPSSYGFDWKRGHVDLLRGGVQAWSAGDNDEAPEHDEDEGGRYDLAQSIAQGLGIDVEPFDPIGAMLEDHNPKAPQA